MSSEPNAEQVRYWNETSGPKWVARMEQLDALIAPVGEQVIAQARPREGERVLDVGCGCGQTLLQLAERVGAAGRVLGVDVSGPMLARAAERTRHLPQVQLLEADAQLARFDGEFDLVFSRFGVMFFQDPVAAFRNLRGALVPDGRLAFVCWDEIGKNPWMRLPLMALAAHVPLPEPPAPGAPGPFSFADPERVRGILVDAGFANVEIRPRPVSLAVGGSGGLDEAVDFLLTIGPASQALREAGEASRSKAARAVREALAPFVQAEGVAMDGAVWICSADASG
jgi:SAM-dependent methyltransferase